MVTYTIGVRALKRHGFENVNLYNDGAKHADKLY